MTAAAPTPLWTPNSQHVEQTAMHAFMRHVAALTGEAIDDYPKLHAWSLREPQTFWRTWLDFSGIKAVGSAEPISIGDTMRGTHFFPELRLNFAENLLRHRDTRPALISISESRAKQTLTYADLFDAVCRMQGVFKKLGVKALDRVAGLLPNIPEAVVSMLATTSLGAMFSSSSPDFGVQGVLGRFGQIKPRILIAPNAYHYNGKRFDCREKIERIAKALPELEHIILIPLVADHSCELDVGQNIVPWQSIAEAPPIAPEFTPRPFEHPTYVLYSSGTTGMPKCIVHGAGGTLLQHTKELCLHSDLGPGDNIFYFTTCGWMMWNWLVSALFTGSRVTLFDGSPGHPNLGRLWDLVDAEGITHFGTSPKFVRSCQDNVSPAKTHRLDTLRIILSTGAPLLPEDFEWLYTNVKKDVQVSSISGGTDIISCFMLGNPLLPVYAGEIQAAGLGMDIAAYDGQHQPVQQQKGELVCRQAFPSMPVYFWNDPDNARYQKAYFPHGDAVWYHGDYVAFTGTQEACGGIVVYGRSDATLNPGGVRIGTAEIYRIVEGFPEIDDSLVVGKPHAGDVDVVLFLKLRDPNAWSDALAKRLRDTIRQQATPRHVPKHILPISDIPYTLSGKKVEIAVRELLCGQEPANRDALANPQALDAYRSIELD